MIVITDVRPGYEKKLQRYKKGPEKVHKNQYTCLQI